MPLESATHVSGLNSSNPVAGDGISAGDDHIRLVKQTLVNSFPAVSGAVTASHTELNHTDGVTSNIQTQLNAKAATGHGHAISDTTGLQAALDAKAALAGANFTGIVDFQAAGTRAKDWVRIYSPDGTKNVHLQVDNNGKLTFWDSAFTTRIASLDQSGNLIVAGNVTAYGTP
jgi:hypothetical protein